jgi:hypothetical protein
MLRVLKVAALLTVAGVSVAAAAPGPMAIDKGQAASGTAIELVRAGGDRRASRDCRRHCHTSRHHVSRSKPKADGRRYASYRKRGRVGAYHGRSRSLGNRAVVSRASAGTSRGCLTPSARALLGRIEGKFGAVKIISTCRPGATIAGSGRPSRHASGNAIDFDAGGRKAQIVSWLVANHKSGGTMTYPAMSHVHVDVGPHFVSLAGGRRYASWSSRRKASHRVAYASKGSTYRKRISVRRGPALARVDSDSDD